MEDRYKHSTGFGTGEPVGYRRRLSWGAIIAGTVAALAVQLLLTLLGMAIGLWTMPAVGTEFAQELGIGAVIWAVVSFIIALYCGGWIAGRMSGLGNKTDGLLEGFMVWGVVTVVTFMLLTTAVGGLIGGAAGLASEIVGVASEQIDDPEAVAQEFGDPAREALEDVEIQQEDLEQAATAGGTTVFGAFLGLLLGAVAASLAGRQGSASGLRSDIDRPGGKAEVHK